MDDATSRDTETRHILFRLGSELFATPLLEVREIIEPQPYKSIPHVEPHFLGMINLRGSIAGVIDLRRRFGLSEAKVATQVLMVFDTQESQLAALVDRAEAVISLVPGDIEKNSHVATKVPQEFFLGMSRIRDEWVSVLSLKNLLCSDRYGMAPGDRPSDKQRGLAC